jgi:hypothetical protein
MKLMITLAPLIAASMLSIESWWWPSRGAYLNATDALGFGSPMRYALELNRLIDTELALQLDPHTTAALRAKRERGQRSRSSRLSA